MKRYRHTLCLLLAFICSVGITWGQNMSINSNGAKPDSSAMLDVSDTTRGFLMPRMTTMQMNAIVNPAQGLLVYNTDSNGICAYDGTQWLQSIAGFSSANPDTLDANVFSARIANNGAASVTSQSQPFIQSVERTASGYVTVRFTSGFFTVAPAVVATIESDGESASLVGNPNTDSVEVVVKNYLDMTSDRGFAIHVQRQGADYIYNTTGGSGGGSADNLGDHVATQNLQLDSFYISGDGDNEGIRIDNNGKVGIGTINPLADLQISEDFTIEGRDETNVKFIGANLYMEPSDTTYRYIDDGAASTYAHAPFTSGGFAGLFYWESGLANGVAPNDANTYLRLTDDRIVLSGGAGYDSIEIALQGFVDADSLIVGGTYSFPRSAGASGQGLIYDGSGALQWGAAGGAFTDDGSTISETDSNYSSDFVVGSPSLDYSGNATEQRRMFFDKAFGAFRAGRTDSTEWDNVRVGDYSVGMGYGTRATSQSSIAMGEGDSAGGIGSVALGYYSIALADYALAGGWYSGASGQSSVALGRATNASGLGAVSLGYSNSASGQYSVAMGNSSTANAENSLAAGNFATTGGTNSISLGSNTNAYSAYEIALGRWSETYAPNSTTTWNTNDRLFVVSNGTGAGARNNAFTVMKNGNIGIDVATPAFLLDVGGSAKVNNLRVNTNNLQFGASMEVDTRVNIIGASNPNLYIGPNGSNYVQIQCNTSSDYAQVFTPGTRDIILNSGGDVGVKTTSPSYTLHVNGSVAGTSAYNNISDRRYKTNIEEITSALELIMELNPVKYDWKREEYEHLNFEKGRGIGFIAQEVEPLIPEMVQTDDEGIKSLQYAELIPILTKAIQEQEERLQSIETENEQLRKEIERLTSGKVGKVKYIK